MHVHIIGPMLPADEFEPRVHCRQGPQPVTYDAMLDAANPA